MEGDEYWTAAVSQRLAAIDGFTRTKLSFPSHITVARQVVQDEISALRRATRLVGTRWNELTPICRLPQEVLAYIFHLHVIETRSSRALARLYAYSSKPLADTDICWVVQLTHVCRLWRHLALSLASIWTDVTFSAGVEWGREMLERSKTAPVNMELKKLIPCDFFDGPKDTQLQQMSKRAALISAHLHHIRSMSVLGCLCDVDAVLAFLAVPAPILEKLEIGVCAHSHALTGTDRLIVLGPDFLSEDAPKLRLVRLWGCALPWTSPLWKNLVNLEISHNPRNTPVSLGSAADLIQALQNIPALDSLKLENCFPQDLTSHRTSTIVTLPILTKLGIAGTARECAALLRLLETPSSTSLKITCTSTDATGNDCCVVLPAFSATLLRPRQAGSQPLLLELFHTGSLLRVRLSEEAASTKLALDAAVFDVTFAWAGPPCELRLPTVKRVLDFLAEYMKSLRIIHVRSRAWRAEHWLAFFSNATQVHHVWGDSMAGWSFPQAISPTSRLFPKLQTMQLVAVDFRLEPPGGYSFIDHLSDQLNARAEAGLAVEKLIISQCTVPPHMVTPLRDVVAVE